MEFKPATCPECKGALQVPTNQVAVRCMYCGSSIVVNEVVARSGDAGAANLMRVAEAAVKAGNFTEAFNYYTKVLEIDLCNHEAWFGKGEAAGWLSSARQNRIPEMLSHFHSAIECSPEAVRPAMIKRTSMAIAVISLGAYREAAAYWAEQMEADAAWAAYINTCWYLTGIMEQALKNSPRDKQIVESMLWLLRDMIQARPYTVVRFRGRNSWYENKIRYLDQPTAQAAKDRIRYLEGYLQQL
jgi:tetratricopeptide (TPR) repeat protein